MAKKQPVSNGIFEQDGQYYMMCGDVNVPIRVITTQGRILGAQQRTPKLIPQERTPYEQHI